MRKSREQTHSESSNENIIGINRRKNKSINEMPFPIVNVPVPTDEEMNEFLEDLITVNAEKAKSDERLEYILSR
ncbi:MAG: hypothetical protein MJZ16_13755 [Bacteroidales bacterium]|nr:hypothetical protein [Bacteroidales bacterium]